MLRYPIEIHLIPDDEPIPGNEPIIAIQDIDHIDIYCHEGLNGRLRGPLVDFVAAYARSHILVPEA